MGKPKARREANSSWRSVPLELAVQDRDDWNLTVTVDGDALRKTITVKLHAHWPCGSEKRFLHWGRCEDGEGSEWFQADELLPPGSSGVGDGHAAQTPFSSDGICELRFSCEDELGAFGHEEWADGVEDQDLIEKLPAAPRSVCFVIKQGPDGSDAMTWLRAASGGDFRVKVASSFPTKRESSSKGTNELTAYSEEVAKSFLDPESQSGHWSQFQRFCLCAGVVSTQPLQFDSLLWALTVMRLAQLRKLDWFRRYNYQPKDFAHVQESLAIQVAKAASDENSQPLAKGILRLIASIMPRGNSRCGDAIRMRILDVMRSHGIKEGHRPGIEDKFLEQWHQKLHTNSAPDDIIICEAYLAFLESGNGDKFWSHLWHAGHLSRDLLRSLPQPITHEPLHLPQLQHDIRNFLGLLKSVHSGGDLDFMTLTCKGQMSHEAECVVFDILNHRHEWWVPGKVNEARRRLEHDRWKKDVLILDCALEGWQLLKIGAIDMENHFSEHDALGVLRVLLESIQISRHDEEVEAALSFFNKVTARQDAWSEEWGRLMVAALERITLLCTTAADVVAIGTQRRASNLARAVNCSSSTALQRFTEQDVASFGEETCRALPELHVARVIRKLFSAALRAARMSPWETINAHLRVDVKGTLVHAREIKDVAEQQEAIVLAVDRVTGWEDIPRNFAAILASPASSVDTLSHIAIRARNQGVVLLRCADSSVWDRDVRPLQDGRCTLSLTADGWVKITSADEPAAAFVSATHIDFGSVDEKESTNARSQKDINSTGSSGLATEDPLSGGSSSDFSDCIESPSTTTSSPIALSAARLNKKAYCPAPPKGPLVLMESQFKEFSDSIGNKSKNLTSLAPPSASDVVYLKPESVCIPFGVFERELEAKENATLMKKVKNCEKRPPEPNVLAALRGAVESEMEVSSDFEETLKKKFSESGQLQSAAADQTAFDETVDAVRRVWASKWSDRAVSSRVAEGIPDAALLMGVLVQNVIAADYAFVVHTQNPLSNSGPTTSSDLSAESATKPATNTFEFLIEIVVGLGEPLVSNAPGKALSVVVTSDESPADNVSHKVLHYPSKNYVVRCPCDKLCIICRSDSNGEDLAEFAGAGLYDSHTNVPCHNHVAKYSDELLVFDHNFREHLLRQIFKAARSILSQRKRHQDIEGCVKNGQVYIVQTRDQVGCYPSRLTSP